MSPFVSLLLPTRGRVPSLTTFLDSLRRHTSKLDRIEVILIVDEDDTASREFRHPDFPMKTVVLPPKQTMGRLNSAGLAAATGEYILLVNDDLTVETPAWDERVAEALREFPDRMVLIHINEGIFGERLCTFPFVSREFCELAAPLCPEAYRRYRIDDHIHNIFDLLTLLGHRRRVYLPDVIFRHSNFEEHSEQPVYVPNPIVHEEDTRLFDSLLGHRKEIALRVKSRIDSHFRQEESRVAAARLAGVTDSVAIRDPGHHRKYPFHIFVKGMPPRSTVAVVSADLRSDYARECVDRIKRYTTNFDLVLLDNNRGPGFNHSREMNRLIELCRTDFLALLDDDALVGEGWMEAMIEAMEPGTGVVTPVHTNRAGELTYAGVVLQPDESGHHTHVMAIGNRPEPIQTLCSAAMLINMSACGHLRIDESYSKYFMDIDFGLRVWEVGHQAVCTPHARIIHLAGATLTQGSAQAAELYESQRQRWRKSWAETGRLRALRSNIWQSVPALARIEKLNQQILGWFEPGGPPEIDAFLSEIRHVQSQAAAYPALRHYWERRIATACSGLTPRADEAAMVRYAVLQGFGATPTFCESRSAMNIVICEGRFYAIPNTEGAFSLERFRANQYSRQFEADTLAEVRKAVDAITAAPSVIRAAPPSMATPTVTSARPSFLTRLVWFIRRLAAGPNPLLDALRGAHSALFSPAYYLEKNPDVAAAGVDPVLHYTLQGWREGRNPHPLFDPRFYESRHSLASGINPLLHYVTQGSRENLDPHPLFDSQHYRKTYRVPSTGNLLMHFLANPANSPHPWFDSEWYIQQYHLDPVAINPLEHYLRYGSILKLSPHPGFDVTSYLQANPAVELSGENPLSHYVQALSRDKVRNFIAAPV